MAFSSNSISHSGGNFDAPLIGDLKLDTTTNGMTHPILYHNEDPAEDTMADAMDPALHQNQFYDAYVIGLVYDTYTRIQSTSL